MEKCTHILITVFMQKGDRANALKHQCKAEIFLVSVPLVRTVLAYDCTTTVFGCVTATVNATILFATKLMANELSFRFLLDTVRLLLHFFFLFPRFLTTLCWTIRRFFSLPSHSPLEPFQHCVHILNCTKVHSKYI